MISRSPFVSFAHMMRPVVKRERHLLDCRKDLVVRATLTLNHASRVALLVDYPSVV